MSVKKWGGGGINNNNQFTHGLTYERAIFGEIVAIRCIWNNEKNFIEIDITDLEKIVILIYSYGSYAYVLSYRKNENVQIIWLKYATYQM